MKFKAILAALLCAAAITACRKNEDRGEVKFQLLSPSELHFEKGLEALQIRFLASRSWELSFSGDEEGWLSFEREKGETSAEGDTVVVQVAVLPNKGADREGEIRIALTNGFGYLFKTIAVSQKGSGDPNIYFNDFDKTAAQKTGNDWPDIDSDVWRNEKGSGIAGVQYSAAGKVSFRNNATYSNDAQKSLYSGSGVNKLFLGTGTPSWTVQNIDLGETRSLKLNFGAIRSVYNANPGQSVFDHNQFKVQVSADQQKWVEVPYTFASGSDPDAKWDYATAIFSVAQGVNRLSIRISASETSTYSVDDFKLSMNSGTPGPQINL